MFGQTSIKARLALLVGGFFLTLLLIGIVGVRGITVTGDHYETDATAMVQLSAVLDNLHHRSGNILRGMGAESFTAAEVPFKLADQATEDLQANWATYIAAVPADEKTLAEKFGQAWQAYLESSKKTIEMAKGGDYERAMENMKGDAAKKFDAARQSLLDLMAYKKTNVEKSNRANAVAKTAMLAMLLFGMVVGSLASWRIVRSIARPIANIQETIGAVEKTSDFTRRVKVESKDEIGQMAQSFNSLMTTMQTALREILDDAGQASATARELSEAAAKAAVSSASQSEAASAMAATMEQITVSINHVSDNARDALTISRNSGELSEHGGVTIQSAAEEMLKIAGAVRETSGIIVDLGEKSNQISSVVQVIKDVAEQTNLLALNAAIEAARAGEQGRGFAVVADEVRKLAERTTQATLEIGQMIAAIQSSAHAAVEGMSEAVTKVDGGAALAQQAGDAIRQIKDGAVRVVGVVKDISSALAEQSSASNEVARNVEQVAMRSEDNNQAASAAAQAAERMVQLNGAVREAVERFRI
jgi:methyl-accepting chemotaxis protein